MKMIQIFIAISFLLISACSSTSGGGSSNNNTVPLAGLADCPDNAGDAAVICGTVLAADGVTPIANATVSLVSGTPSVSALRNLRFGVANTSACLTDDVGQFACEVESCSGSTTFLVESTSLGDLEFDAECNVGDVTAVPTSSTTLLAQTSGSANWLVVPGGFDGIQLLLSELKGCTLTGDESAPSLLRGSEDCESKGLYVLDDGEAAEALTTANLANYQAVFVNCSADHSDGDSIDAAIQSYVENGGNIYFSDLSASWFSILFPDPVTFSDSTGSTGTLEGADIPHAGLSSFLASNTMNIDFNSPSWRAMDSIVEAWTTYISGDTTDVGVPGDRPITVGGPHEDGCAFYTSYHVSAAGPDSDQEKALKYLILNKMSNCE